MVKPIMMIQDYEVGKLKLKKGSKHSVYKDLYDELVNVKKVAKDAIKTKKVEGDK